MWKKDETPEPVNYARPEPTYAAAPPAQPTQPTTPTPAAAPATGTGQRATIGRSITIKGEVTGDEDLLIQGRVEGSVDLKQHSVTVGQEGEVKADISGRIIAVEGKVEGNLTADEQVILRSSAIVRGDILAPRVVLENGARFRGGVDMGESVEASAVQPSASGKSPQTGRPAPPSMDTASRRQGGAKPEASASSEKPNEAARQVEALS